VTAVAVGLDGTLYATEMSTGNLEQPPFLVPGTGRLVRQTGPDSAEAVVSGVMLPIALAVGPDHAFYVALPALGADQGEGVIARFAPAEATASPMASPAATSTCPPIPSTGPAPHSEGTPGASPVASPTT
jgi:hypothetical protein